MSSPVRLATSRQQSSEQGALPEAEIIPYPGAHPAAADMKKGFDLAPITGRLRSVALTITSAKKRRA